MCSWVGSELFSESIRKAAGDRGVREIRDGLLAERKPFSTRAEALEAAVLR
jgi:hypothetical protein